VGEVLLDVQMPSIGAPSGWLGAYMSLSPQDGASTHPGIDGFRTSKIGLGLGSLLGGGPPAKRAAPAWIGLACGYWSWRTTPSIS
jgi:hypothetical protein